VRLLVLSGLMVEHAGLVVLIALEKVFVSSSNYAPMAIVGAVVIVHPVMGCPSHWPSYLRSTKKCRVEVDVIVLEKALYLQYFPF